MSGVQVLVGTRKGAFVLTSDGKRDRWNVSGPHFGGWEIYHLKGSPANPDRLYASQSSGWFGQLIQRSDDGGRTWTPAGKEFVYEGVPGTHQWYDGTPHPWQFARVWHLEPSPTDPDTVYAGVEDAALFRVATPAAVTDTLLGGSSTGNFRRGRLGSLPQRVLVQSTSDDGDIPALPGSGSPGALRDRRCPFETCAGAHGPVEDARAPRLAAPSPEASIFVDTRLADRDR